MRIAVLGPGGVGGLLAALLAGDGHDVLCLAGSATAEVLRERGIRVASGQFGERTVTVDAAELLDRPVNACLVAVKATQLDAALERVPAATLGAALLVPFLNGVEHLAVLRERYPKALVVAAAIRVESARVDTGRISHTSPFARVDLCTPGPAGGLADALERAGLEVHRRDDEVRLLWDKLAFLAPFALLTTVSGEPVGVVRDDRADDLRAVVIEIAAVSRAEGGAGDAAGVLAMFASLPSAMRSSMQRDADSGRALELDALGGAVLRAAARHGLDVPVTAALVAELARR